MSKDKLQGELHNAWPPGTAHLTVAQIVLVPSTGAAKRMTQSSLRINLEVGLDSPGTLATHWKGPGGQH